MDLNSKKQTFIRRIEHLILSGELKAGEKLPTERQLVEKYKTSRTVVNASLAALAQKGFITVVPRKYTIVADYKKQGTLDILESIMTYNDGNLDAELIMHVLDARALIEIESVRLAANNRTEDDLAMIKDFCDKEQFAKTIQEKIELDYLFHHSITIISKNAVYPLIYKSFEPLAKQYLSIFYKNLSDYQTIMTFHQNLYQAIKNKNAEKAVNIMSEMLLQGKQAIIK
jgi:GntR family transcriptional regulator, transcriptional repressor for pyruvate dehydrogenase complex